MATSFGYTDKVTTTKNLALPDLSYATDYALIRDDASEVVISNTTSPLDQPETIRFALSSVADVYQGTGIEPSFRSVTKRGESLLVQINDILRVTDAEGQILYDLPISSHIVVKLPLNEYVTADVALQVVKRNISALFDTGLVTSARLNQLLRSSLKPSTM